MTRPWRVLECVQTRAGPLELRRRGERDFLITLAGRVLMNSAAHRSEVALAELAAAAIAGRTAPRLLIGGLGMGYTLRAALDALPAAARITVAELEPAVVRWCRGPLSALTHAAVDDARVRLEVTDVANVIAAASRREGDGGFDAIALDLLEGPRGRADPHFGDAALRELRAALAPGGVVAIWSESPDAGFERRLAAAGFRVERSRPGRGGLRHAVTLGRRLGGRRARPDSGQRGPG
jgi:spermidine synthase